MRARSASVSVSTQDVTAVFVTVLCLGRLAGDGGGAAMVAFDCTSVVVLTTTWLTSLRSRFC
ncbi:hypothetical protein PR001_g32272 [Phytophthora rubi]|uniref:Uncharacterized protein n=1 Tax=Phytophthora rubi TaxID=129364 RepID=A0A6A3GE14_9STRA|nr:hypothetical protein PR001_g32272 [Phytophthora rubi]